MFSVTITRRVEFDAGHRIPNHKSKCRNIHGHRYILEATVAGPISDAAGDPAEGMVVDFGDLKAIMIHRVAEPCDHAFLVYSGDSAMVELLELMGSKYVALPVVPTAENLVRWMFDLMVGPLEHRGLTLSRVLLYETPNSWAVYEDDGGV